MTTARDWYTEPLAEAYALHNPSIRPGLRPAAAWVAAAVPDGGLVLDLGCGAGRDLASLADSGARVVGVDIAMPMLTLARRRHPDLVCGDLTRLPLRDAVADAVWCVAAWVHIGRHDLPHAIVELARVLRPGGVAVIGVQRGSGEAFELDPYIGQAKRLMVRYEEHEIHEALRGAGLQPLTLSAVDADLCNWVTLIVVKPHGAPARPR
jgi:ubiquinone/menaquinone biosynthesis C-methylase UbiE